MRVEKDNELALIARELTLLQSNMLKDQKRLEGVIADKQAALDSQSAEADRLRKQNKKLQLQLHSLQSKSKQQLAAMQVQHARDITTLYLALDLPTVIYKLACSKIGLGFLC